MTVKFSKLNEMILEYVEVISHYLSFCVNSQMFVIYAAN